jgi:predicted Zn-dependent protease
LEQWEESFKTWIPQTTRVALFRAEVLRQNFKHAEALEVLEQALKREANPDIAVKQDELQRWLQQAPRQRLAILDPLLVLFPRHHKLRWAAAEAALDAGSWDLARLTYQDLLREGRMYRDACEALAEVDYLQAGLAAAETQFDQCAEQAPNQWDEVYFLNRLGRIRRDQDDFQGALDRHLAASQLVGGQATVLHQLGLTYRLMGELREAERYFQREQEIYSDSHDGTLALAYLDLMRDDVAGARSRLEGAIRTVDDFALFEELRLAYLRANDLAGFEEFCLRQAGPAALHTLALALLEDADDPNRARQIAGRMLAGHSRMREAHEIAGRAELALGNPAAAEQEFAAAIRLGGGYDPEQLGLIQAILAQRDFARAERAVEDFAIYAPRSFTAWRGRYLLYRARGDSGKAHEALRRIRGLYMVRTVDLTYHWTTQAWALEREAEEILDRQDRVGAAKLVPAAEDVLLRLPHQADLWKMLADLALLAGDSDQARRAAGTARLWNPVRYSEPPTRAR